MGGRKQGGEGVGGCAGTHWQQRRLFKHPRKWRNARNGVSGEECGGDGEGGGGGQGGARGQGGGRGMGGRKLVKVGVVRAVWVVGAVRTVRARGGRARMAAFNYFLFLNT